MGGYSFVVCLSHLTIDHASLSRRARGGERDRWLREPERYGRLVAMMNPAYHKAPQQGLLRHGGFCSRICFGVPTNQTCVVVDTVFLVVRSGGGVAVEKPNTVHAQREPIMAE